MLESQLHFISAILILFAAVVPIYLTIKLRNDLRKLVLILTVFILVHSVYHIVGFFGITILAEAVFEPLSVAILIFFGVIYYELARPKNLGAKNLGTKGMASIWSPVTLLFVMNNLTTMMLFGALGIFVWLAVISKNVRTFQFQISIFIIIWILGEIVGILRDSGIIVLSTIQGDIGLEIHVVSMFFFSIMLWLRFYSSQKSGRKIIEDVDATTG